MLCKIIHGFFLGEKLWATTLQGRKRKLGQENSVHKNGCYITSLSAHNKRSLRIDMSLSDLGYLSTCDMYTNIIYIYIYVHNINDFCVYVWCIYKYYIIIYFIHMNIIYYAIISTPKTPLKIFQSPFFLPNTGEKIKHPYKVGPKPIRYQWSYGTLINGLKKWGTGVISPRNP